MQHLLYFLLTYQNYVFLAMFGMLTVVAFVNFVHNPYAKQNAKLKKFDKKVVKTPSSIIVATKRLPSEYQRQWRAFVNCGCQKPSTVFEFVKLPNKYLLWFAHLLGVVVSVAYIVISVALHLPQLFAIQIVFLLGSALVLLINSLIVQINISHARRVFGKFLHDLNVVTAIVKCNKTPTEQPTESGIGSDTNTTLQSQSLTSPLQPSADKSATVQQPASNNVAPQCSTQQVQGSPKQPTSLSTSQTPTDSTPLQNAILPTETPRPSQPPTANNNQSIIDKAVNALRQKGLTNPRTVEEQRKLNVALNNLLQACCKHNS